jgi:hypothetical protein
VFAQQQHKSPTHPHNAADRRRSRSDGTLAVAGLRKVSIRSSGHRIELIVCKTSKQFKRDAINSSERQKT